MRFGAISSTMQQPFHFLLLLFIAIIIFSLFPSSNAQPFNFPSANISTKWINNQSIKQNNTFINGVIARYILVRETSGPPVFGCGFICHGSVSGSCNNFLFSIFIGGLENFYGDPQIVWSANRDRPVREDATFELSKSGNLLLQDFDGTTVWSSNTSGKAVVGMELNEVASLVLFDNKKNTVWSSMDYPTDSLVLGQTLRQGQRLTANVSATNSSQGPFYLSVVSDGIQAVVGSQIYYNNTVTTKKQKKTTYVSFKNGSLDIFVGANNWNVSLPLANYVQYMRLDYTGHLRVYEWNNLEWILKKDVLTEFIDDCGYPTVCGEYGICSKGRCSCPDSTYFTPIDESNPNAGCMPISAISCNSNKSQDFLFLPDVSYFGVIIPYDYAHIDYIRNGYAYIDYIMLNSTEETCKQACLANCSCKAAFFLHNIDASNGTCYLPPALYSLNNNITMNTGYNSSAFIKVESFPNKTVSTGVIVAFGFIIIASLFVALLVIALGSILAYLFVAFVIALVRRIYSYREVEDDDDEFSMLPGLPRRFTFEDLRIATNDFLQKLGEGGFGSVFEGTLIDGTKIAVKRLDGLGQGKKEFLAEVETIGSIHHINLVRLVGFCAEKFDRLLVYEYMPNGSLDKWIFYKDNDTVLDWQTRRKIITDIAKGLVYLHEDCRQKIVHLDIKPQNILLDDNFDAKVSDFGLAKFIGRDQIEVRTNMKGTPGYLAPEWLTSVITEKVDVFSFGVVVLEIVCGRKNIDNSKDEENFHLISLLQSKVAENKLVDMVDCRCTDMQIHIKDVIMIMHLAMWCLQSDSNKRPLMSVVLKVLEGSMDVEIDLDYNFSNITPYVSRNANIVESAQPTPSTLSGPR